MSETNIDVRHNDDPFFLEMPRCNKHIGFRDFRMSAPRLLNDLPVEIKESVDIARFKSQLKTFIFGKCYQNGVISDRYRL